MNELIAELERTGPGLIARQIRAMAREAVLQRLELEESRVIAADLIGQLDNRAEALKERLPGLDEREQPQQLAVAELQEQVVDLVGKRTRSELDGDARGVTRLSEQLTQIERQIQAHRSELTTVVNLRGDLAHRLRNLEAARVALATLAAPSQP